MENTSPIRMLVLVPSANKEQDLELQQNVELVGTEEEEKEEQYYVNTSFIGEHVCYMHELYSFPNFSGRLFEGGANGRV